MVSKKRKRAEMRFLRNIGGKIKRERIKTKISDNLKLHTLEGKLTCNSIRWQTCYKNE
jgi:hypothetical protein